MAIRLMVGLKDESHERRLTICRLEMLEDRRRTIFFKTGRFDFTLGEILTLPSMDNLRTHRPKLYHWHYRQDHRGASFR